MYDKHLDIFILTAEKGSFSKAGEAAFITPSAVIKQINLLENDLGVTLFTRTSQGVTLTEAGKIVYQDAKQIIKQVKKTVEKAKNAENRESNTVRIGTSTLCSTKPIMELWSKVSDRYSEINIQLVQFDDSYDNWVGNINYKERKFDLSAVIYASEAKNYPCKILDIKTYPLCLFVPKKHRLAKKKKIVFEDLYGERVLITNRGMTSYVDALRDEIEQKHPQIVLEDEFFYDVECFNHCNTAGISMIGCSMWSDLCQLTSIPCEWNYSVPYGIIYPENPSKPVQRFIEAIKEALEME